MLLSRFIDLVEWLVRVLVSRWNFICFSRDLSFLELSRNLCELCKLSGYSFCWKRFSVILKHGLFYLVSRVFFWCKIHCAGTEKVEPNRIWGEKCTKSDIVINQGSTAPLPSGIPTYTVEIMNMCVSGCDISAIHLRCGWFSSARLINPKLFKRLRYNDCLVNDGRPLVNGGTVSFQYANTYLYPLSVSSVVCVWRRY